MNGTLTVVDGVSCASVDAAIDRARSLLRDAERLRDRGMIFRMLVPENVGDEYMEAFHATCRCALLELSMAETRAMAGVGGEYTRHIVTVVARLRDEIHDAKWSYTTQKSNHYRSGASDVRAIRAVEQANCDVKVG